MIEYLSGAVTLGYIVAALFFLRFWRTTADRLFLAFAVAFVLFALNQGFAFALSVYHEPTSFIYALRVIGFLLILAAIIDKNLSSGRTSR
jgi:peptidoglycan/LPS O-acetylase OafA/YrhL